MMSLSCSTIVALFHLLSSVLMAITASRAVVASSNQWSAIHCILFGSPMLWRPIGAANDHRNDAVDTVGATCLALI
jgi:hypothetical protein